jgi:hypothetical protein
MTNTENNLSAGHVGITVLALMCIVVFFVVMIQRQVYTQEINTIRQEGKEHADKAQRLQVEADSLVLEVWARDSAMIHQHILSLRLIHQMDSIHESYQRFAPVIATAGRDELRVLSDSILSGFNRSRERYLVLLNSRSPADVGRDSLGTGGL